MFPTNPKYTIEPMWYKRYKHVDLLHVMSSENASKDMSVSEALKVLGLNDYDIKTISSATVVRQYRRLALKHHPDKNGNSDESNIAFHELSNAYDIVRAIVALSEESVEECVSDEDTCSSSYFDILSHFVNSVMSVNEKSQKKYVHSSVLHKKIIEIVSNYQEVSISMFENIDRDTSMSIYHFLSTYRDTLYISSDILESIRVVIQSKFDDLRIYSISPTLNDMFLDNVFKLNVDGHTYLVPLWHKEIYFDDKSCPGQEILVLCEPDIDELTCRVDDNNNLHISTEITFSRDLLFNDECSLVTIPGSTKSVRLTHRVMTLTPTQVIRIIGEGILRIHEKDMYNNIDRGDIFVTVRFV